MIKGNFIVILLLVLLVMLGCTENSIFELQEHDIPNYHPSAEDVVNMHGNIENIERFMEFLNNVEKGQKDNIKIVSYTEEGDPILQELLFNGEVITSISDTRRDKFGAGSINEFTCISIKSVDSAERTDYMLEGCENTIDNVILVTWK